jgi:hypothetical protein
MSFLFLGLFAFGLFSYFKHTAILLRIGRDPIHKMQSHQQVIDKLKLSQHFTINNVLMGIGTIVISVTYLFHGVETWICAIMIEIGILADTLLQAKYFLFRRSYCGEESVPVSTPSVLTF